MHSKTLFALALAVAFYAVPRCLQAQAASSPSLENMPSPSAAQQAAQMVPAQARLAQNLETKSLQPGAGFKAVLQSKVHLKDGTELPRGTSLVGTVANDVAPQGEKSGLALRFTQADLKSGRTIPIEATIVGVAPPETNGTSSANMVYNAPPNSWDGTTLAFDENDALSGIDLHSRIAGQNSGVFVSDKKSNLKLGADTQLSLAIGAQNAKG